MKNTVVAGKIALAGQPNTGKSTVFNCLTGAHQHVGNWPGKTVEQKSGTFSYGQKNYAVVDLPGTYSLTAGSMEEKISRNYIINERPDVVVVMADASQLERSLYLFTEIRLLSVPAILVLNMLDIASRQGKVIDIEILEKRIGVPVVPMIASKGEGKDNLLDAVVKAAENKSKIPYALSVSDGDHVCSGIKHFVKEKLNAGLQEEWVTAKLVEKDSEVIAGAREKLIDSDFSKLQVLLKEVQSGHLHMAGIRYRWISDVLKKALRQGDTKPRKNLGRKFDRVATHPLFGRMIAVLILVLGFTASMLTLFPMMLVLKPAILNLITFVDGAFTGDWQWFGSLLGDGLIPGLSVSLFMLLYIVGVYFVFALLEDIGYVARLAYLFDGPMNKVGLHGKSFMPLLLSFGCNIAGVTGTRVIDSWKQRMVTMVMVSIVPCMALWAVVSFLGAIFFSAAMPLVVLSLLFVMMVHLAFTSFILRKFVMPGETTGLIMELPPYHRPNWKTIFSHLRVQAQAFLLRACTLITVLTVVVWALSYRTDGNMELSVLASIGRFFDPVTRLIGLDWRLSIALLAAMVAKEASLSVIAVLFGIGSGVSSITYFFFGASVVEHEMLAGTIAQMVSPASALAFIFAFFFSIPCTGTVASIYSETKSLKWTAGCSLYYIAGSFIMGGLAYRVGLLIF